MRILFLLKSLEIGGVEIVTANLANKFVAEGHDIVIWSFSKSEHSIEERINKGVHILFGNGYAVNEENVHSLRKALFDYKIEIVINQWGLPYKPTKLLKEAKYGLDVKTVAVCHCNPSTNGKIIGIDIKRDATSNFIVKSFLWIVKFSFKLITSASMRYVYDNSNYYMVLADAYKQTFSEFTGIINSKKILSLPNPITINSSDYNPDTCTKEKMVLYVGRLENVAKRVYRIIEVWKYIEATFPDWKLVLVGDGPERGHLQDLVNRYCLNRVQFVGFQKPNEYYKKSCIQLLTSEFEGFPLVLAEASSYGTIPVVYGSFPAVYDIIDDDKNGLVITNKGGFDAAMMAESVISLMQDDQKRKAMSYAAYVNSKKYSVDILYKKWMALFENIL